MSDDILCAVEGCQYDAEVEVERNGATLWLCGDHYKDFIKPHKHYLACPQCKSNALHTTLMGYVYCGKPGPNLNRATCQDCGWVGTANDAGAPLIKPMQGTENMTEEEIKNMWAKWVNSGMPMYETLGIGIINLEGIKRLAVTVED